MMANDTPSLLVPVRIRAALAGKAPIKDLYSDFSYDFTQFGDPYAVIEKPLFTVTDRQPGIYLHWTLPDCLSHGIQDETSKEITYRLAPNRWAVTRLWSGSDTGPVKAKTFLLESDVLSKEAGLDNMGSPTWPFPEDLEQPCRFLGRSFPATEKDSGSLESAEHIRLTAVSPVSPFFAAYSPMCQNVFGFYDDLPAEKINHVKISYVVCGWYEEDDEPEPLKEIADLEQLRSSFGLTVDAGSCPWPEHLLCHGLIDDINWEDEHTCYPSGTPDDPKPGEIVDPPRMAAGNNSSEALAALSVSEENDAGERLMQYFLQNMENDLDRRQGIASAEKDLQHTKFSVEHTTSVTGIRILPENGEKSGSKADPLASQMERLSELRKRQRKLCHDSAVLLQKQRNTYENWYLHLFSDPPYNLRYMRSALLSMQEAYYLGMTLKTQKENMEKEQKNLFLGSGYETFEEREEPFYTPNEPVLVISQMAHSDRRGASQQAPLFCRMNSQTVTSLNLTDINGKQVVLDGKDLCPDVPLPQHIPAPIQDDIRSLNIEALLLSHGFALFLAESAFAKLSFTPTASDLDLLERTITRLQDSPAGKSPDFTGFLPEAAALERYCPKWQPLILEWEAQYYPDMALLSPAPSLEHWTFLDGDYVYTGTETPDPVIRPDNAYTLSGRLLISDNASLRMEAMIMRHFSDNQKLLDTARSISRFSQALDGFNSFFLMREHALPPPLFTLNETEQALIQGLILSDSSILGEKPLFDQLYSPIRAGFLSLSRVRIIDELGRFQDVFRPNVYAGEGLRTLKAKNPVQYLMLPPRFVQPSRLNAYFLSAGSGRNDSEAFFTQTASPVCGFLLPNRLDHSVVVYTADGAPAGSLNLTQAGQNTIWLSPPGTPASTEIPQTLDPELYSFLTGLKEAGPASLQDFVEYMNDMQFYIQPGAHDPADVEFIGRPIAIARLSVKLELLGEKEPYLHYRDGGEPDKTSDANVMAAKIPAYVGSLENPVDGVIGFFEDGDYDHLHVYESSGVPLDGEYFSKDNKVILSPDSSIPDKIITLLVDPWSDTELFTGFLPVRTLRIPEELTSDALKRIAVTFFCAPVLTGTEKISLPIPHSDALDFYWESKTDYDNWSQELLEYEDPAVSMNGGQTIAAEGYVKIQEKEASDE